MGQWASDPLPGRNALTFFPGPLEGPGGHGARWPRTGLEGHLLACLGAGGESPPHYSPHTLHGVSV